MTAVHADEEIVDEITQNYLAQCDAMVGADISQLGSLLAPDFTLAHMTGYLQRRAEWLDDIATGQMTYHSIRNVDIVPETTNDSATITARSRTTPPSGVRKEPGLSSSGSNSSAPLTNGSLNALLQAPGDRITFITYTADTRE